jgi:hypothetical protein
MECVRPNEVQEHADASVHWQARVNGNRLQGKRASSFP